MDDALAPDDLRATALRGFRATAIGRPASEVLLLAAMVILARLIPPAEFGRYAVAVLVGGLGMIPAAAIGTALVQRASASREHLQTALALSLLSALALCALTILAASVIITPIFGARTAVLVRLSAPGSILVALNTVPVAILQRRLAFRQLAVLDVIGTVVRVVASIALALMGLSGAAIVLGGLAGALVALILSWCWASPPTPRVDRQAARDLSSYGLPAAAAAISWVGFQNCDYLIVGARLGALQSGYYFRAYTLGIEYQKKVSIVMNSVGFAVLARARTDAEMGELRGQMVRLLTVLLFPLLVLLAVSAPVVIPWLFGPVWTPAVVPTQILAVGGASVLVTDMAGAALMAAGRPRAQLGFGWGHFITYGSAVVVVSPLGIQAVAVAASAVHTLFMVVSYRLMLRGSDDPPLRCLWHDIAPATVCSATLAAVAVPTSIGLTSLHASALPYLTALSLVSAVAYALVLRIWFSDSWRMMRALVQHLLPKRRPRSLVGRPMPELTP